MKRYPEAVASIVSRGHEIGCHGNNHEILAHMTADEQREALMEARELLTEAAGKAPLGFRMPEGEISEETLTIAKELGFTYSSSLSDDDVPYVREISGLLELPIHWELFDLPYFVFTFDPPIPPGQSRSARMDDVLKNWLYELKGARRFGTLFNLQLDPRPSGSRGVFSCWRRCLRSSRRRMMFGLRPAGKSPRILADKGGTLWQKQH